MPIVLAALAGFGVARIAAGGAPTGPSLAVAAPAAAAVVATPGRALAGGEAALRGSLDLNRALLDGDRFVAPLGAGRRAVLTLDPALQAAAERVLLQAKAPLGAIVVMHRDGRILALAGRQNQAPVREHAPELALSAWAPSASIFKLVTAAALVGKGVGPDHRTCFHGGLRGIDATMLQDDRRDDRCETLGFAVAESQNAIIAKLATRHLGAVELATAARALGYDDPPDFALAVEPSRFTVPTDPLEFARMAAGFWSSELTPIDAALMTNTIATGGLRVRPRIVEAIREGGERAAVAAGKPRRALPEKVARAVGSMMKATTTTGTAYKGFHDKRGRRLLSVDVAGKTGSLDRDEPYLSYSWFVGYAPADDPEVTIAVLLGNPMKWHLKAHTAARLVLDTRY